jgi:hypothetical protein
MVPGSRPAKKRARPSSPREPAKAGFRQEPRPPGGITGSLSAAAELDSLSSRRRRAARPPAQRLDPALGLLLQLAHAAPTAGAERGAGHDHPEAPRACIAQARAARARRELCRVQGAPLRGLLVELCPQRADAAQHSVDRVGTRGARFLRCRFRRQRKLSGPAWGRSVLPCARQAEAAVPRRPLGPGSAALIEHASEQEPSSLELRRLLLKPPAGPPRRALQTWRPRRVR